MSIYKATAPPTNTTCDMRGCGSAAEVRVIVPKLRFTADGAGHSHDPDTWDSCDLHWPRFRDGILRNGHDVVDVTGDLRQLVADSEGWTIVTSDSGRLYAASYGMTLYGWLVGPFAGGDGTRDRAGDGMTEHVCSDSGEYQLRRLRDELAKRGVKSELHTHGAVPRLRVYSDGTEFHDAETDFNNSVVACCFGHDGWYAWPWAEPIARVREVARAAGEILDVLGADNGT